MPNTTSPTYSEISSEFRKNNNLRFSIPGRILAKCPELGLILADSQDIFYMGDKKKDQNAYNNFCFALFEQYREKMFDVTDYIECYRATVNNTAKQIKKIGHNARFYTINMDTMKEVKQEGLSFAISELNQGMLELTKVLTKSVFCVEAKKNKNGTYNVHAHLVAPIEEINSCLEHVKAFSAYKFKISCNTNGYICRSKKHKHGKFIDLKQSAHRMANYIHKPFMGVYNKGNKKKKMEKDFNFHANYEAMRSAMASGLSAAKFLRRKSVELAKLFLNSLKMKGIVKTDAFIPEFTYSKEEKIRNIIFRLKSAINSPVFAQ